MLCLSIHRLRGNSILHKCDSHSRQLSDLGLGFDTRLFLSQVPQRLPLAVRMAGLPMKDPVISSEMKPRQRGTQPQYGSSFVFIVNATECFSHIRRNEPVICCFVHK